MSQPRALWRYTVFAVVFACTLNAVADESELDEVERAPKNLGIETVIPTNPSLADEQVNDAVAVTPSPSPELKKAENINLKDVVVEPEARPLPQPTSLPQDNAESQSSAPAVAADKAVDQSFIEKENSTPSVDSAMPEGSQDLPEVDTSVVDKIPAKEVAEGDKKSLQTPLIMLDSEVPAGTSTRLSWTPEASLMGIAAPSAVLVVHGAKPGPKVCLTAAIHGDELNGIEVTRHILYSIDPQELAGTLIGVPIVNLQGFRRSSRYLADRRDLNRYFPGNPDGSSASRIAYSFFNNVVRHCDMLVDLHTGSFHRTNLPQLRANLLVPKVAELAKQMGSIVVVHSEGTPGCLRRAAVDAGIPAVTLEAGQPHQLKKSAVNHGIKSVESLLDSLSMVDRRPFWKLKSEPVYYQSQWIRAVSGGILFSEVELGDHVDAGDTLGVITDPITNLRHEVTAPVDGRVIGMALNQVMYPGFAAYHLGLQSSVDELEEEAVLSEAPSINEDGDPEPEPAAAVEAKALDDEEGSSPLEDS